MAATTQTAYDYAPEKAEIEAPNMEILGMQLVWETLDGDGSGSSDGQESLSQPGSQHLEESSKTSTAGKSSKMTGGNKSKSKSSSH